MGPVGIVPKCGAAAKIWWVGQNLVVTACRVDVAVLGRVEQEQAATQVEASAPRARCTASQHPITAFGQILLSNQILVSHISILKSAVDLWCRAAAQRLAHHTVHPLQVP